LDVLEAAAVDLDNPIGDRMAQRVRGDVVGFADTAAGDLGPDVGLGRDLFDEALERPSGEAVARAGGKQGVGVFPAVAKVSPE
jgi:hypothetical protein